MPQGKPALRNQLLSAFLSFEYLHVNFEWILTKSVQNRDVHMFWTGSGPTSGLSSDSSWSLPLSQKWPPWHRKHSNLTVKASRINYLCRTAGGQYHWVSEFSPPSIQKPASFFVVRIYPLYGPSMLFGCLILRCI